MGGLHNGRGTCACAVGKLGPVGPAEGADIRQAETVARQLEPWRSSQWTILVGTCGQQNCVQSPVYWLNLVPVGPLETTVSGPRGTVINYWEGGLQNAGGKSIFASAKREREL